VGGRRIRRTISSRWAIIAFDTRNIRSDPDLQALHARHPVVAIWDDHEVANDTWREGAQNHKAGQGSFRQAFQCKARLFRMLPTSKAVLTPQGFIVRWRLGIGHARPGRYALGRSRRQISRRRRCWRIRKAIRGLASADRRIMSDQQERWIADTLNNSKAAWQLVAMQNPALDCVFQPNCRDYLDQNRALTTQRSGTFFPS
jgi:alkaline phosphatase D